MTPEPGNGWSRYEVAVMGQLSQLQTELGNVRRELREENERLRDEIRAMKDKELTELRVKVGMLEVRAGAYGLLGGLISAGVIIATVFLRGGVS